MWFLLTNKIKTDMHHIIGLKQKFLHNLCIVWKFLKAYIISCKNKSN